MNRPTCGTCPHRVRYLDSYGCARETPRGVIVGDTALAVAPYVPPDYPGCQHHPEMGKWLASLEEPAVPAVAESKPQRYGYRQPGKTLADQLAELSVVRDWLASLPYPPPGETLAERLGNLSAEWTRVKSAPRMDAQLAELEQWRGAFVWEALGETRYELIVKATRHDVGMVSIGADGQWRVGRYASRYADRDAAMRAAEQALELPKCRVEGEP